MGTTSDAGKDARLGRSVLFAAIALAAIIVAFGVYYYQDRYTAPSDVPESPSALQQLEEKVRSDPKNADARLNLAENYLLNRRYADAIAQAEQVAEAYPKKDRALLIIGVAYNMDKKPSQALEPLQKFIKLHEKAPTAMLDSALQSALYFLAESYLQLDKPAEAVKPLKKALAINATDADSLYQLGLTYARLGKHKQALEVLQKATALVPDFGEAYEALAASYSALGEPDLAAYARAMVAYSSKDYETARDSLIQVVAEKKDFAPAYLGLGLVYEQLGELKDAKESLRIALKQEPESIAVVQALGRVNAAMQQ